MFSGKKRIFWGLLLIPLIWGQSYAPPPQGWDQWQDFPTSLEQKHPILSCIDAGIGMKGLFQTFLEEHNNYRELWFRNSWDFGFRWENPIRISNANVEIDINYDFARSEGGASLLYVAWSEKDPMGLSYQLWFGYSTDCGMNWTIDQINDDLQLPLANSPYYPSLIGDASFKVYLTFYFINTSEIGYAVFDAQSGSWSTPYETVCSYSDLFGPPEIITNVEAGQDTPHIAYAVGAPWWGILYHARKLGYEDWTTDQIYASSQGPLEASELIKGPNENTFHVAFRQLRPYPDYIKTAYTYSTDNGQNWNQPPDFFGPSGAGTVGENICYDGSLGGVNLVYCYNGYSYYRFKKDGSKIWSPETVIAVKQFATLEQPTIFSSTYSRHVAFQVSPLSYNDYVGYVASHRELYSADIQATAKNNGRHLTRRSGEELYICYQTDFEPDPLGQNDRNWVYFASSNDGGQNWSPYTWLNYGQYPAIGQWSRMFFPIPVPMVYLNYEPSESAEDDTIYFRYYSPNLMGGGDWSDPIVIYHTPNTLEPPAVTAVDDTVFIVFAENSGTESWIRCARFRYHDGAGLTIDDVSPFPVTGRYNPSIQYDGDRTLHAVWREGNDVYYNYRRWQASSWQFPPWNVSESSDESRNPFIELWGDYAYCVWTEDNVNDGMEIYRRIKNIPDNSWGNIHNTSNSPGNPSDYANGSYRAVVWSEWDPEDFHFDIRYFFDNSGWIRQSEFNSNFSHTAIRPDMGGWFLYTIWTEETGMLLKQILSDRRFFLPSLGDHGWYSVEAGNNEPSPFLVQREGIKEYANHKIDYDSKELIYELSFLDPVYDYYLIAGSYHEGAPRKETWFIDGESVGEYAFQPNKAETVMVKIPYEAYAKDRKVKIAFKNTSGSFAARTGLKLINLDHKQQGGGGQSGGSKLAIRPRVKITPNPTHGIINLNFSLLNQSQVKINLFDLTGRKIYSLHNKFHESGKNCISLDIAKRLSSGIYFLTFEAEGKHFAEKIVLQK